MSDGSKTFSQKLQRLEEVVRQLERPDIELEDGLQLLEEGIALHQECQEMLSQTQAKITTLLDGSASTVASEPAVAKTEPKRAAESTEGTLFEAVEVSAAADDEDLPF